MPQLNELYLLTKEDIKAASIILSKAFQNDPALIWEIPNESTRLKKLHIFWEIPLCLGIKYGEIYAPSEKLEGIAMWLPPKNVNISLWKGIKCGGLKIPFKFGISCTRRMFHVENFFESTRKHHTTPPTVK